MYVYPDRYPSLGPEVHLYNVCAPGDYSDPECEYVFTRETKELYDTLIWFGQELAQQESLWKEAERQKAYYLSFGFPNTAERIFKRVLLGTFAETPNGPQGRRAGRRDQKN